MNNIRILAIIISSLFFLKSNAQFGTSPWTAPSGTYVVPVGVTSITVECRGGGGGGGGARSSSGNDVAAGGGGGGAYSLTIVSVTPGQSITVAVGASGTQGANSGGNGGNGGASTVTYNSVIVASAAGGIGGTGGTGSSGSRPGGTGGSSGTGTVRSGGNGGNGFVGGSFDFGGGGGGGGGTNTNGSPGTTSTGTPVAPAPGGAGGSVGGGNGGNGFQGLSGSGAAGSSPGGGGGGGASYNGGSGAGGLGGAGSVLITYLGCSPAAPSTPLAISGADTLCSGAGHTYSIASVSGATSYTWTLPSGWSGTSTTETINVTAGANGGTISVTADNTCGSSPAQTKAVVIRAAPATPGVISGPASVCATTSNSYSVTPVSGATSYTWTLPSGWSGSSVASSINTTAGSNGGTISVIANNQCTSSSPRTFSVTIGTTPANPGAISGLDSVCSGSSNSYSIATVAGATSYTWTLPSGWSGTSTIETINTTAGTTGGTISVVANGCGTSAAKTLSVVIKSIPSTPLAISGADTLCSGVAQSYSIANVAGATSYTWTLPSGWSGSSTSATITATSGVSGGMISVTANNGCGSSSAQTLAIVVNAAAPVSPTLISGNNNVCEGTLYSYSVSPVANATSYTWSLPNGWSGSSLSDSIEITAGATSGVLSVTANNLCGSSSPQTLSITSNALPVNVAAIIGDTIPCAGSNTVYKSSASNGATSYLWNLPNGWSGSSTADSIFVTVGTSGGQVAVTAQNFCGSSATSILTVSVNNIPATPTTINGPSAVCSGSNNSFSVPSVAGATDYIWALPNGWSGTSVSENINVTPDSSAGVISVSAKNACGSSSFQTLNVSITPLPSVPGIINGTSPVCAGSTNTYTVSAAVGASSYTWTLPNGWSGSSSTPSISATANSIAGNISVVANNACGSSSSQNKSIAVSPLPQVTFDIVKNVVCKNLNPILALNTGTPSGGVYAGSGVTGVTFNATNLSVGNYVLSYSLTSAAGCVGSDTANVTVSVCTSIDEEIENIIAVYPNPFNTSLNIFSSNNEKFEVLLTDIEGRRIRSLVFDAGSENVHINTANLANGIYLLNLNYEGKSVVKKLIKTD